MNTARTSTFELYARPVAAALLALGCFFVMRPFLGAIMFAAVLCFSTWPVHVWMRRRLGGRSWLAALVLVVGIMVALLVPLALAAESLIVYSPAAVEAVRNFLDQRETLTLPAFIRDLPLIGDSLDRYWQLLMQSQAEVMSLARRFADPIKTLLVAIGGGIAAGLIQVLIALFVAFFFYRDGERVRDLWLGALARLAGPHGGVLAETAQAAVKGVVYGLIGTAFVQAIVAALGFVIAGVPGAAVLGALTFLLSLIPMGPVLVWGGAAAWLYAHGHTGWTIFMVIYGIAVISSVDNFVKPVLMSRAGGLSMLLVVLGVFGGAVAFGFIGLFVGPALLAIGWSIMKAWVENPASIAEGSKS